MCKVDNTALFGFMGVQNNHNLGFYAGAAGWGFVYDVINSRVGIGTSKPVNRLDVAWIDDWNLSATEGNMRIGNASTAFNSGWHLQEVVPVLPALVDGNGGNFSAYGFRVVVMVVP